MNVVKRDGRIEELDVGKIKKYTRAAVKGLEDVITSEEIEADATIHFMDGMKTSDIQLSLIRSASEKIDVDRPEVTYVAARLFLSDLYQKYINTVGELSFVKYIEYGVNIGLLNPIFNTLDIDKYAELIDDSDDLLMERDFLFTYTAIVNLDAKNLKRNIYGNIIELPQYIFLANSIILGLNEPEENRFEFVKKHYNYVSSHKAMTATPTLSNARLVRPTLSSCFIGATFDSIEGINKTHGDMSLMSKFGGGIGWDWNDVRASGTDVDGVPGASGGIVPFLNITNSIANAVDQLGCTTPDTEVLLVESAVLDGNKIDLTTGKYNIRAMDEIEGVSSAMSNKAYEMNIPKDEMNKASLAISCLFTANGNVDKAIHLSGTIYDIDKNKAKSYIDEYISLDKKAPEGFVTSICGKFYISELSNILDKDTLIPLTREKDSKGVKVLYKDKWYIVRNIMVSTFLKYRGSLILHKDGDIYNTQLDNLTLDKEDTGISRAIGRSKLINKLSKSLSGKDVSLYTKPIKDVKVGDLAVTMNGKDIVAEPVLSVYDVNVNKGSQYFYSTGHGKVETSAWHPVEVVTNNGIVTKRADELQIGDSIIYMLGSKLSTTKIKEVGNSDNDIEYKDLTIANTHRYFVKTGNAFSLVHNTRKGAIAVYIEPWHMNVFDFLDSKNPSTEDRLSAHDLFPALWIPQLFMDRISEDGNWTLFDSRECKDLHTLYGEEFNKRYEYYEQDDTVNKRTIKAKELLSSILKTYFETGNPFLLNKDEINRRHQCENIGVIRSSNLCVEVMNATSPGVEVTDVMLEKDGETFTNRFDSSETVVTDLGIEKSVKHLNRFDYVNGDRVCSVENQIVDKKTSVCNLSSINLGKLDKIDDLEPIVKTFVRALDNTIDLNYYPTKETYETNVENRSIALGLMGEHHMLANKGVHYGSKEHYELIDEICEKFSYWAIEASVELAIERGSYPEFEGSSWSKGILPIDTIKDATKKLTDREPTMDWDTLRERVKGGIRNGYIMAIAPTSSISVITGTTSSIEPIFKRVFMEENLSGNFKVIAPNLNANTWGIYKSAYEIDQMALIELAAIRQKWIDQSQSLNLFVIPEKITGGKLKEMYIRGFELGVKSFYYLRSKSLESIQSSSKDNAIECEGCQ